MFFLTGGTIYKIGAFYLGALTLTFAIIMTWCVSLHSCVELIICEQMNKYKVRLKDISTLEFAENKAKCKLTLIRRSMVRFNSVTSSCVIGALMVSQPPLLLHYLP